MTTLIERDLTAPEVARALGMAESRARSLLRSGAVRTVYTTPGVSVRRVPDRLRRGRRGITVMTLKQYETCPVSFVFAHGMNGRLPLSSLRAVVSTRRGIRLREQFVRKL